MSTPITGAGVGWRPPVSDLLLRLAGDPLDGAGLDGAGLDGAPPRGGPAEVRADERAGPPRLAFSEVIAETIGPEPPAGLRRLREAGVPVIAHGVGLGLAGADRPDPRRLAALAAAAERLGSPLVSEHVAFVRAGTTGGLHGDVLEAGHLVPGPRTRDSLDVLCANVSEAMAALPVPLALENPAGTLAWPEDTLDEPDFLTALVERTGCWLLLDLHNLVVTCRAQGGDPRGLLERMPLERVAYVHVAGGAEQHGVYLDTHAHPVPIEVLDLLGNLVELTSGEPPGVLLERDDDIRPAEVEAEYAAVCAALARAGART